MEDNKDIIEAGKTTEPASEQTFTQEQVNEIVRKRLERSDSKFFESYGVKDKNELDELVKKSKGYDELNTKYTEMSQSYEGMKTENLTYKEKILFFENNILNERQEDVKVYFKGKGIDFTDENLKKELETHPEWCKKEEVTTIQTLGSDQGKGKQTPDEKEIAAKYFGFKSFS